VKAGRRDAGRARRQDGLAARYSGDTAVALRRGACLAVRPGGLGRGPTGLPDEQEIVARAMETRQDAARQVRQPQDALPRAPRARCQAPRVAGARPAAELMAQVPFQWVSQP
jgi:hypothetical protein